MGKEIKSAGDFLKETIERIGKNDALWIPCPGPCGEFYLGLEPGKMCRNCDPPKQKKIKKVKDEVEDILNIE